MHLRFKIVLLLIDTNSSLFYFELLLFLAMIHNNFI